jgi:hypothetical protein
VAWVKKKTGPAISVVKSSADAEELLKKEITLAVAFLDDFEGKDAEELTAVARQEDGILFYMTGDVDIAKVFGLNKKVPALVLLKKQKEKLSTFDGAFERGRFLGSCLQISCPLWLHSAMKQHQLFLRMKSADTSCCLLYPKNLGTYVTTLKKLPSLSRGRLSLCLWILQISNWLLLCWTSLLSPLMRQR